MTIKQKHMCLLEIIKLLERLEFFSTEFWAKESTRQLPISKSYIKPEI